MARPPKRGNVDTRGTNATEGNASARHGHSLRYEHPYPARLRRDGLTLTLNRMGQAGKGLSIGLMAAETALVFLGLYAGGWSR